METFLGIDVGTSSVKAVLVAEDGRLVAEGTCGVPVSRPRALWSEQDPEDWWRATLAAMADLRARAPEEAARIAAIGLSGQQHSATLLDARGAVLRPAILWNDGRCGPQCAELHARVPDLAARTGNIAMTGYTAPKLLWVAEHEPDIFARIAKILLPKDYLRHRLTGTFVSDMSDSAGTLWLDVRARRWDEDLIAACGLRRDQMPDLVEGSQVSGRLSPQAASALGLTQGIPVAGGGGDNASTAVGLGAVGHGEGFVSLGTSGVVFVSTDRFTSRPERTLHAFCHALPERWHVMAVVLSAAASLEWIAQVMGQGGDIGGLVARAEAFGADPERRARAPIFLPYLAGERTPHNDPAATASFDGLRIEHGAEALAYAVLEGVAFALADCLDVVREAGVSPSRLVLAGGGARSAFWSAMIADALGVRLDLCEGSQSGAALGAARLGMLAAGLEQACAPARVLRSFTPNAPDAARADRRVRFRARYAPTGAGSIAEGV